MDLIIELSHRLVRVYEECTKRDTWVESSLSDFDPITGKGTHIYERAIDNCQEYIDAITFMEILDNKIEYNDELFPYEIKEIEHIISVLERL